MGVTIPHTYTATVLSCVDNHWLMKMERTTYMYIRYSFRGWLGLIVATLNEETLSSRQNFSRRGLNSCVVTTTFKSSVDRTPPLHYTGSGPCLGMVTMSQCTEVSTTERRHHKHWTCVTLFIMLIDYKISQRSAETSQIGLPKTRKQLKVQKLVN